MATNNTASKPAAKAHSRVPAVLSNQAVAVAVPKAAVDKAGRLFRSLRDGAGLTLQELGQAIDLNDVSLLEELEVGKAGLPFEIILRMAGVLGRNDPIPIALKLTRAYNPKLWATLENLGIGRLAVQARREREFANLYRESDAARQSNNEELAAALKFVRASFEAALTFSRLNQCRWRGLRTPTIALSTPLPRDAAVVGRHGTVIDAHQAGGLREGFHRLDVADAALRVGGAQRGVEVSIAGAAETAAFVERAIDGQQRAGVHRGRQAGKQQRHFTPRHDVQRVGAENGIEQAGRPGLVHIEDKRLWCVRKLRFGQPQPDAGQVPSDIAGLPSQLR